MDILRLTGSAVVTHCDVKWELPDAENPTVPESQYAEGRQVEGKIGCSNLMILRTSFAA